MIHYGNKRTSWIYLKVNSSDVCLMVLVEKHTYIFSKDIPDIYWYVVFVWIILPAASSYIFYRPDMGLWQYYSTYAHNHRQSKCLWTMHLKPKICLIHSWLSSNQIGEFSLFNRQLNLSYHYFKIGTKNVEYHY